jgi:hypothetical protein
VNKIADEDPIEIHHLTSDEVVRFYGDGIRAQLADVMIFSRGLSERAHLSHVSMAMGSVSVCNDSCEIFEAIMTSSVAPPFATLASVTAGKMKGVTAEQLSKVFCIPHDDAVRILSATTQLVRYNTESSLSRNVSTNDRALRYRRIHSSFFTDTLFATKGAKSTHGNICAQLFASDKGFVAVYPMKDQQSYFLALKEFAKDVGTPDVLVCDSHPTQKKREVKEFLIQIGTRLQVLEAETQWCNQAELYIGIMKEACMQRVLQLSYGTTVWNVEH